MTLRNEEQVKHIFGKTEGFSFREKRLASELGVALPEKESYKYYMRKRHLMKEYGITPDQYEIMVLAQENCCAICGEEGIEKKLHVDHDHETGRVRGLLCNNCNAMLGLAKERPWVLKRGIDYLATDGLPLPWEIEELLR